MSKTAFRNQRPRFRNYSPPYGDKKTWDADTRIGVPPRGGAPSPKNGRVVAFWTIHEYRAFVLLEACPEVLDFEERPERVAFRDGPRWYSYVPHFRVALDGAAAILELSAEGEPRTPRQMLVADFARAHYARRGIRFIELAHRAVRAQPRFTDALRLTRLLLRPLGNIELLKAKDAVANGPVPLAAAEEATGISRPRLLAMVRTGALALAGPGPITGATLVGRPVRMRAPR